MRLIVFCIPLLTSAIPLLATDTVEKARYLRPAGAKFETECEFTRTRTKTATAIESVTSRGKTKLTVTARYDDQDTLTAAEAILLEGDKKRIATVTVAGGKAMVKRDGQPAQEFDVPKGVIVTSAPDWTDVWMLCRRYHRTKGGKQEFAGLWIHPVQPSQRLTFAIERTGKKQDLDQYKIWLRGNSSYAAWADSKGELIKLVPLPYKDGATNWLVREGHEKSTAQLRP